MGDERKILKIRQRNRKMKKSMPLSKKHLGPALEVHLEGSPNLCKSDKRRYKICSTHRRTVSHPVGREDGWSEEDDPEYGVHRAGGQARSWDATLSQGSCIGLDFNNNVEAEEDSHVRNKGGSGNHLKVLAAKKVLGTQKKEGVSFAMKEGGIIDKLVDL